MENKNSLNEQETIVAPFKPDEEEPYIFISYSHKDRNRVFPIITRLYEKGWRIWYDEGIEVTENYYTSISRHIRKCTVFLLFVTENSVKSEFVCEHELLLAASYRKIMAICRLDENAQFTDEAGDAIALATISSKNPKTDETGLENALSNIAELKKFPPRKAVGYKIRRNNTDIILADEDDEYDFEVCGDGIRLTGYNGNSEIVHVPIIYKGQPVIELDDPFRCSQTIKKIYIPEGVKKVTVSTFLCSNLSDIYIPESLDIQDVAFFNISIHCSNNTKFKQGIIQDNVKIIYDYNKFERNTKCPTKKYTFCIYSSEKKEQVKTIISSLKENNCDVIEIDDIAEKEKNKYFRQSVCIVAFVSKEFTEDNEIEFIYRAVESEKPYILYFLDNCSLPDDIAVTKKYEQWLHFENGTYEDRMTKLIEWIDRNGCRKVTFDMPNYDYTTDLEGNIIITKYTGNEKNISIPDTFAEHKIVAIGSKAFFNLQNINSIIISDNIKNIGYRAFEGCSSLTSVNIPNSVISIGDKAFYKCFSLNSITLSNNITNIGYEMFGLCINLKSINICNNIINIGDGAFFGCSSLETISIPYNVIKIGNYAFEECDNLKFITILNNSADIGEGTFSNCGKLIVCCNENSYAWRYCEENNIPHKPMEEKSNDC